jgi:hypothetical protein
VPGLREFLAEVDHLWVPLTQRKVRLSIIGSAALMLQADYERGTKDSDVLETKELTPEIRDRLVELAGQGTKVHARHRMYLEIVAPGFPFLPQSPRWIDRPELNASLRHFDLEVLDVVDVVVSKLKRFNANDQSDVDAMVAGDLVPHERLLERFRAAVDFYAMDARAEDLPRYLSNLHRVERDFLDVPETPIELPDWI